MLRSGKLIENQKIYSVAQSIPFFMTNCFGGRKKKLLKRTTRVSGHRKVIFSFCHSFYGRSRKGIYLNVEMVCIKTVKQV